MSLLDMDRAVTFTVQPPRLVDDPALYEYALQNVGLCTPDQRHALAWALSLYENPSPAEVAPVAPVAPVPARRMPSWLEVVRGVECCDAATVAKWQRWRICFIAIGLIVLVAGATGIVAGDIGVVAVLVVLFVVCAAVSKSITGGSASVCH
jgi:uncharacterized membrane protein YtjA (UPF0391 family)